MLERPPARCDEPVDDQVPIEDVATGGAADQHDCDQSGDRSDGGGPVERGPAAGIQGDGG